MKTKTIEILAQCERMLPVGTKVIEHYNGREIKFTVINDNIPLLTSSRVFEVDFSQVEPLYPHKGMIVPEEGIGFADGEGKLIDVGMFGFNWQDYCDTIYYVNYTVNSRYQLKQPLPKTITVCAECFKEVCECKHESGWYRVKHQDEWKFRYYDKEVDRFAMSKNCNSYIDKLYYSEIDWTPVNPVPENKN